MIADSYISCPSAYKSRRLCEKQQGCQETGSLRGTLISPFSHLSYSGAREGRAGRRKQSRNWADVKAMEKTGISPAQVAIHGFHIIVLAACKGLSWLKGIPAERKRSHTVCGHNTHRKLPGPTHAKHQRTHVENSGSAGDLLVSQENQQ